MKARLRRLAVQLICLVVALVGLLAWPFGRRGKDFKPEAVRKILVIRLDLLGDLVLSMPAVAALRDSYPQAAISMLVLPYTTPLLAHYPFLARVFAFDVNRLRPSGQLFSLVAYRELWALVRSLRAEGYDLAISLHGVWGSMFAFASGAPFRAGYRGESCPFMLNLAVPGKRYRVKRHEADYCLDLAHAIACRGGFETRPYGAMPPLTASSRRPAVDARPVRGGIESQPRGDGQAIASQPSRALDGVGYGLSPLPAAQARVDDILRRLGIGDDATPIVFHTGATNGAAKRWTIVGMATLADRLMDEDGGTVVFTGTKSDLPVVDEVARLMRRSPTVLAGATSIPELVALLARCRLLVSGDTGPMHLAVALGVPVVAIHGPSDPALSGPYGGNAIVVRRDVPCGPCYDLSTAADCPLGDPICMKSITVDEVYAAAKKQLAAVPA